MVYISNDGQLLQSTPLFKRIFRFFTGIIFMIAMFFQTLVQPGKHGKLGNDYSQDFRPGGGPPGPATRRLGRPNTGDTVNIPFGGCSSCAR